MSVTRARALASLDSNAAPPPSPKLSKVSGRRTRQLRESPRTLKGGAVTTRSTAALKTSKALQDSGVWQPVGEVSPRPQ